MLIFAVTGKPILHSMSPDIFRMLFPAAGVDASYTRLAAENAGEAVRVFRELEFSGMNVTAPFKESILEFLDETSEEVRILGAANTLVRGKEGRISGKNTDPEGVLGPIRFRGIPVSGKKSLVLGAGGAGKAAAYALMNAGAEVLVVNRTEERARELASSLGCHGEGFDRLRFHAARADILVSTLASENLPDPSDWLCGDPFIIDADYKTGKLFGVASGMGIQAACGLEWLVHQALPAYTAFLGSEPRIPAERLVKELQARAARDKDEAIALIGFMACGKTESGKRLAELSGREFFDLDSAIERKAGRRIPEIFRNEGESAFRRLESETLGKFLEKNRTVLATGGGSILSRENRDSIRNGALAIWLYVGLDAAVERAKGSTRPLLAGKDPEKKAQEIFTQRRELYAGCAELVVSTEGKSPTKVAEMIYDETSQCT